MKKISFVKGAALLTALFMIVCSTGCGNKQTTSEYWVTEEEWVDVEGEAGTEGTTSGGTTQAGTRPSASNSSSGSKGNSSTGKNNSSGGVEYNFVNVGTKGANGKDYSNYNPYEGIEKLRGTTIKFASWINHGNDEFSTAIKTFKEKYGITVESVYCEQATYLEKVNALIAAGKTPDIIVENAWYPSTLQIAQEFSTSGLDTNEPFWDQKAIKGMNPSGKVYFVNSVNSVVQPFGVVLFQRDIMLANGIKTPEEYYEEGTWTLDNLVKCAKEYAALGNDYSGVRVESLHTRGIFGGQYIKYDGSKFINNLTSNASIEAGKFSLSLSSVSGSDDGFIRGKTGILIRDSYALKRTGYVKGVDADSISWTYLPTATSSSKEVKTGFLRGYGICKGSKNAKAAGMFIRYMLDPNNIDLSTTFLNEEAGQFYYEAVNHYYGLDYNYDYSYGVMETTGVNPGAWLSEAGSAAQVATVFQSHKNELDNSISKANAILAKAE